MSCMLGHAQGSHFDLHIRLQKSYNKQAERWQTTTVLLCMNQRGRQAEAGKIVRLIHGKLIVVFHQ